MPRYFTDTFFDLINLSQCARRWWQGSFLWPNGVVAPKLEEREREREREREENTFKVKKNESNGSIKSITNFSFDKLLFKKFDGRMKQLLH